MVVEGELQVALQLAPTHLEREGERLKLGVIQGGALFGKTVLGKPLVSGGPYKGRFDAPDAKLIMLP